MLRERLPYESKTRVYDPHVEWLDERFLEQHRVVKWRAYIGLAWHRIERVRDGINARVNFLAVEVVELEICQYPTLVYHRVLHAQK